MDQVQKIGLADPDRLGIGGWSYGGILTNYTIATDGRFKAAISGAGSSNQISMYGTDMYINQYDNELGPPWKSQDLWIKLSYPFFHADRIRTPTLFMGGEKDFNVPLLGSEQMYQALRTLGVDSQLVIYPSQFHGIKTPSYKKDRLERYLEWYGRVPPAGNVDAHGGEIARSSQLVVRSSGVVPRPTSSELRASSLRFVVGRADGVLADLSQSSGRPCESRASPFGLPCCGVGGAVSFDGAEVLVRRVVGAFRVSRGRSDAVMPAS